MTAATGLVKGGPRKCSLVVINPCPFVLENGAMNKLKIVLTLGLVLGLGVALAAEYNVQKPLNLYGNLNQNNILVPPGLGASACGPTAVTNSYVYLEQQYPATYGRSLVPDTIFNGLYDNAELVAVATALAGPGYMNTQIVPANVNSGTFDDMLIYGKYQYIEDNAPGTTVYAAQMMSTWTTPALPAGRPLTQIPPVPKPDWVQDGVIPQWQFLYDELVTCEDVEILIVDDSWGHYLTLTSFSWLDANGDGIIQAGEGATIDYIDPATGAVVISPISQAGLGTVIFVNYPAVTNAQLVMAVAESPVPEPGSWALLLLGCAGLARKRRRC